MTTNEGFDRRLSTWLETDARQRVPDHLTEVLLRTAATRQRPWWSSPERWLPMQTTLRLAPVPRRAWLLAVLGLLVALVASGLWLGSRQRLPAPFGPARNGAMVVGHDGDIFRVDPATHAERVLIGGAQSDFVPSFSRDGTKISFLRVPSGSPADPTADQGLVLVVANADGSGIREVTPSVIGLDWADWSPDSQQIAFLSRKSAKGPGLINVVNVDGSGLTTITSGPPAHFLSWLPPIGREIVFRGGQVRPGIFAVRPDGTGLRPLTTRPPENENDYMTPAVAPDGSRVSYTSNGATAHIHVLDLGTGRDIVLPDPTNGFTNQFGSAYFSPDGRSVGYLREHVEDSTVQFVVAPADGSGTGTPIGPRLPSASGDVNWAFAPDGTAVVVDFDRDGTVQVLPIDGAPGTVVGRGTTPFGDIQRLAP